MLPLLLLAMAPAHAQDVGLILTPQVAVDLASDRPGEDGVETHSWLRAFADGDLQRDARWFIEARAQHHLAYGDDIEGWWTATIGETGWDGELTDDVRLRAGALVERWGKLDLLPLVDVLNPRDLRSGLMTPTDFQKLPAPMAVLSFGTSGLRAETVVLPFAMSDALFLRGTDWSYIRQGMLDEQVAAMETWPGETSALLGPILTSVGGSVGALDPSFRRGLDDAINQKNLPQATLVTGDVAQRLEVSAGRFDGAVMVGYLRSRTPQAELDPFLQELLIEERLPDFLEQEQLQEGLAGGPLKVSWPRTGMVGAEAATLIDAIQVRAEGVYLTNKVLRTPYAGAFSTPQLGAGLGLDYVQGTSLQITLEARYQFLVNPPADMIFARRDQVQLAGGIRGSILADRVSLQLGGSYDASFREYLVLPKVGWRASDTLLFEAGAVLLGGALDPPQDLTEAFVYEGGPASYWGQNDVVTLSVSFIR